MTSSKLNTTSQRWVNKLADFKFSIHYKPGRSNADADCLSRLTVDLESHIADCSQKYTEGDVKAIFQGSRNQGSNSEAFVAALKASDMLVDVGGSFFARNMKHISRFDLAAMQNRDPVVGRVKQIRESGRILKERDRRHESSEVRKLLRQWRYLCLDADGVLTRETAHGKQLILPAELKPLIYRELHENRDT